MTTARASGATAARRGSGRGPGRFLALGDSYTVGEGVDPRDAWPARLAALLRRHGIEVADPETIATTGWTTAELAAGIERTAPQGRFDLVTLLIGVNDQYRGHAVADYRAGLRALLESAVLLAGGEAGRVVVVSIPDWGESPFARDRDRARIASEIDGYNAVARDEAERAGARFADVTVLSRRQARPGRRPSFVSDGLHPTGVTYASWARRILPQAIAALGRAKS